MRYIIQDNYTGYIWGDSAEFADGKDAPDSIVDACRLLDESLGDYGLTYKEVPRLSGQSGYIVYRADIDGRDVVPIVRDGQDRETIEAIERDCQLLGYVEWTRQPDW